MRFLRLLLMLAVALGLVGTEGPREVIVESTEELKGITGRKVIWKKDGAEMVFIPASGKTQSFWMDATEVTVGQFKKFLSETNYQFDRQLGHQLDGDLWSDVYEYSPTDKHPMIYASWHDATAYAKWVGRKLPMEQEWEFAARGGVIDKEYAWGDDDVNKDVEHLARIYANYQGTEGNDKWEYCAPVGSMKANGYGLYDMAGNVWEWCQDWYDSNKDGKVIRGGAWTDSVYYLQVGYRARYAPRNRAYYRGFRCVSGDGCN